MTARIQSLADAVRIHVQAGAHLHFASLPFRSNAAVLEVAHQFRNREPGFVISATGFHSSLHLLPRLGLGARYVASFFGDNFPAPRTHPLYRDLPLEVWSLASLVEAFRAGALGLPASVSRSLVGSDLGRELASAGRVVFSEVDGQEVALVRPLQPDVCFVHGLAADPTGRVVFGRPYCEGPWSALASRVVIATVEQLVEPGVLDALTDHQPIPPHRIAAICVAEQGAAPQPLPSIPSAGLTGYADDFDGYTAWRERTRNDEAFEAWAAAVLDADDPHAAHARWTRPECEAVPDVAREDGAPLVCLAARTLRRIAATQAAPVLLAGIGQSFQASRLASLLAQSAGRQLPMLVEIGLYDLEPGAQTHAFLLAGQNVSAAARLSDVTDVLDTVTCGHRNGAIGVIGAAEVDPTGAVNSTRLGNGRFLVGSGGANDIASRADRVVVLTRCDARRMVGRVAHCTSPGHAVSHVVTDLGVLQRTAGDAWQLIEVCTGEDARDGAAAVARFRARCPWSAGVAPDLAVSPPVSTQEQFLLSTMGGTP